MRLRLLQWVILLSACPPSPRPPVVLPGLDMAPAAFTPTALLPGCTVTPSLKPADVCKNEFSDDGVACVNCPGLQGCFDPVDYIYCVRGGCALDARCRVHLELAPIPDAQPPRGGRDAPR